MTSARFFRLAATLPLVLPALGGLVLHALSGTRGPLGAFQSLLLDVAGFVAFAGVYGSIPYLIYLAVVFGLLRPETERQFVRVVWQAPFAIGVPFALLGAAWAALDGRPRDAMEAAPLLYVLAVGTGLGYAALIELLFRAARWLGWVR